jgi:hypothetical protein
MELMNFAVDHWRVTLAQIASAAGPPRARRRLPGSSRALQGSSLQIKARSHCQGTKGEQARTRAHQTVI